ncbi:hypothetical protein HYV69_02765 [Candidatus Uhrbacteria bacterium]|nr:hypothetical protein [Candidatus Uhrbacteria bacterium]
MKRFANKQKAVVSIPPVVEPVVVEDAPVGITVQNRDILAVVVHRERVILFVSEAIKNTTH